jgi:hypothetical protein
MGQITVYLDAKTEALVRKYVKNTGEPASKWIAEAIRRRVATEWPPEILKMLGSWKADACPDAHLLRDGYGLDARRESL